MPHFKPAIRQLREKLTQLKARGMSEKDARYKSLEAKIDDLEERCTQRSRFIDQRKAQGHTREGEVGVDPAKFSLRKMLLALKEKNWDLAPYEREACLATRDASPQFIQRTASLSDDVNLGNLIPAEVSDAIIPLARSRMILPALGVDMIPAFGSSYGIPRETGEATFYHIGENQAATESNASTDMVNFTPKKGAAAYRASNSLLRRGGQRVEGLLRAGLASRIGRGKQLNFFEGIGAAGAPLGVFNSPGIISESSVGAITFQKLQEMIEDIEANDTDSFGEPKWVGNPRLKGAIKQLTRSDGYGYTTSGATNVAATNPLFAPGAPHEKIPDRVLGYDFQHTSDLAITTGTATLALGIWSELCMAEWDGMILNVTGEGAELALQDQTLIVAITEYDVNLKHPKALNCAFGVTI